MLSPANDSRSVLLPTRVAKLLPWREDFPLILGWNLSHPPSEGLNRAAPASLSPDCPPPRSFLAKPIQTAHGVAEAPRVPGRLDVASYHMRIRPLPELCRDWRGKTPSKARPCWP